MRALLAIALRELRDRWLLLAGALLLGLVPWGLRTSGRYEHWLAAWPLAAMLFGLMATVLAGWSVIGRDLSEGRLAFFFSRPVPWWAIWGGKWLAGAILSLGTALVLWLAVVPLHPEAVAQMPGWFLEGTVAFAGAWCLLFLAMGHVASVAVRSRSPLLALDLALLSASGLLFPWLSARALVSGAIWGLSGWRAAGLLVIVAGVVTAAGAVQVAVGRTDKRRGHRAMSATLWSGLAILLVLLGAWNHRLKDFGFEDLSGLDGVNAAPRGSWVEVFGSTEAPYRRGWFLVDTSGGRVLRRTSFPPPSEVAFSPDGRTAAWLEGTALLWPFYGMDDFVWNRLVVARLDEPSSFPSRFVLERSVRHAWWHALALSPDGSRLAVGSSDRLDVFDVGSGRHLVGITDAAAWRGPMRFITDTRVHAYRLRRDMRSATTWTHELVEVDTLAPSRATVLGRLSLNENEFPLQARDDGRLLLGTAPAGRGLRRVRVHEMSSDRVLTSITSESDALRDAFLLEDGRLAVLHGNGGGAARLDLHSPDGSLLWSFSLEGGEPSSIGGVLPPDNLTVSTGLELHPTTSLVVSLSTGTLVHAHPGMGLISRRRGLNRTTREPLAARLLKADSGGLMLLDADGRTARAVPMKGR